MVAHHLPPGQRATKAANQHQQQNRKPKRKRKRKHPEAMACIDLDFDHSKKFLVFLACANPKVFKNYIKFFPPPSPPRPPLPPPPFPPSTLPYPPAPQNWDPNYYDGATGDEHGLEPAGPYGETIPPSYPSIPTIPNRDRRYGYPQPMELYPDYVRFIPPTKRFPEGPPQLPRRYPPKVPPRPAPAPVVVDAAHPGDAGAQPTGAVGDGNDRSAAAPIVRDVTPPPGHGQTTTSGHDAARRAGTNARTAKLKQQKHQGRAGHKKPRGGKGKGKGASGEKKERGQYTHIYRSIRVYRLSRLRPAPRHTEGRTKHATRANKRSSESSSPPPSISSPRSRSRSRPRPRIRSPSLSTNSTRRSPPSRPSTDYYILDNHSLASSSSPSTFHINTLLPKLRARLHAALRRLHPPEAVSSVRNLSHYSADGSSTASSI